MTKKDWKVAKNDLSRTLRFMTEFYILIDTIGQEQVSKEEICLNLGADLSLKSVKRIDPLWLKMQRLKKF